MNTLFNFRSRTSSIFITLLVFFISSILFSLLVYSFQKDKVRRDELQLDSKKEFVENRITELFHDAYDAAKLIDFVHKHSDLSEFDTVAKDIIAETTFFKRLGIVTGETVTHIYPLKGNEAAIGHNIFNDTTINFGVYKALMDSTMYFTGPYKLRQGGFGIIGRLPHYVKNKYAGFSFVLMDWTYFMTEAGILPSSDSTFNYLVKTIYPNGKTVDFISRSEDFENISTARIEFPHSNLVLYIKYKVKKNYTLLFLPYYCIAVILSGLIAFAFWYKFNENKRIKLLVNFRTEQLSKSREDYKQLFDKAGDMIIITDENGRIKDVNTRTCEMTGFTREELLRMTDTDLEVPLSPIERTTKWNAQKENHTELRARFIRTKQGTFKKLEVNATKISNNEVLSIGRDKTEIELLHKRNLEIEKIFKAGFEKTSIGMAYTRPNGSWIYANDALCTITGYTNEELISLNFQHLSHPDDLHSALEFIAHAQNKQANEFNSVKRYIHKDGSTLWVQIHVTAVRNEENELQFFMALIEDITEKRRLENALVQEKKFSDRVINSIPGILYVTNADGEIIRISENALKATSKKQNDILGHTFSDFVDPSEHSKFLAQRKEAFSKGEAQNEYRYTMSDGTVKTFYFVNTVIDLADEIGTLGIGIDITRMKEYEQQMVNYQKEITERNKELKCLYSVSSISIEQIPSNAERFSKIVEILPMAFIDPEATSARITYKGDEYLSQDFKQYPISLQEDILEYGAIVGSIEIFFQQRNDLHNQASDYEEERNLIQTVSKVICTATEKMVTLQNLKRSEEKYRYLFENLPGTIMIWDLETLNMIEVNKAFIELYGYTQDEINNLSIKQLRSEENYAEIEQFAQELRTNKLFKMRKTWVHLTKSGEKIYMDITSLRITYQGKEAILAVGTNITNLVLSDEKQKELTSDIRRLKSNIESVRDEERLLLSREIHDVLGQKLTLMSLYLSILQNDFSSGGENLGFEIAELQKDVDEQILQISLVINESIDIVRNLSASLRQGVLGNVGLLEAIKDQCSKTTELYKLNCTCSIQPDLLTKKFRASVSKDIYRIYQESVTNVIRHACASEVQVRLSLENTTFKMMIRDNGKGFIKNEMRKNSLGLLGMQERAFLIKGELRIESEEGKGATIIFEMAADELFEK